MAYDGKTNLSQSIGRWLSIQYAKSQLHANANDQDNGFDDPNDSDDGNIDGDKTNTFEGGHSTRKHCCPERRCSDQNGFKTRAKLRRHYQQRTTPLISGKEPLLSVLT